MQSLITATQRQADDKPTADTITTPNTKLINTPMACLCMFLKASRNHLTWRCGILLYTLVYPRRTFKEVFTQSYDLNLYLLLRLSIKKILLHQPTNFPWTSHAHFMEILFTTDAIALLWLWSGNKTFLEVASMVVTWWTVFFWCSVNVQMLCLLIKETSQHVRIVGIQWMQCLNTMNTMFVGYSVSL